MRCSLFALLLLSAFLPARPVAGQSPALDTKTETERATEALAAAQRAADAYRVTVDDAAGPALKREPKPLLQWSNPVSGSFHGSVFVWTANGHPEVIVSIYKKYVPLPLHMGIEFHSLSERVAAAERDGHAEWTPDRGGVTFRPIPGAEAPASTPAQRLRQLRALARDFSATKTSREGITRPLRLLTQPIFRYESAEPSGALFAFVEGTDPEVFLLIESRPGDKGPTWHYALARMNSVEFHVTHRNQEVWSVSVIPWSQAKNPREPYMLITLPEGQGVNVPEPAKTTP